MIKRASTHEEHISRLAVAIHIDNATISYGNEVLFLNANLDVPAKAVMCVMGPNGAGKSTLLKAIAGFNDIHSGSIHIFSRDYKSAKTDISYVPTRFTLDWNFPLTTYDFVAMSRYNNLKFGIFFTQQNKDKTLEAIEMLKLTDKKNTPISQLSDSEREFALVARAVAQDARVIIIDEPFQINDSDAEKVISQAIINENKKGKTILVAHHNMVSMPDFFDSVTLVNKGIVASGLIKEVITESNLKKCYGTNTIFAKEQSVMRAR